MKEWTKPVLEEIDLKDTACFPLVDTNEESYEEEHTEDFGRCSCKYWAGNGKTYEEVKKENPFWANTWGQ